MHEWWGENSTVILRAEQEALRASTGRIPYGGQGDTVVER